MKSTCGTNCTQECYVETKTRRNAQEYGGKKTQVEKIEVKKLQVKYCSKKKGKIKKYSFCKLKKLIYLNFVQIRKLT